MLFPVKLIGLMYNTFLVTLCMTSVVAGPRMQVDLLESAKVLECIPVLGHLRTSMGKKEGPFRHIHIERLGFREFVTLFGVKRERWRLCSRPGQGRGSYLQCIVPSLRGTSCLVALPAMWKMKLSGHCSSDRVALWRALEKPVRRYVEGREVG